MTLKGLEPDFFYKVQLSLKLVDGRKHKYEQESKTWRPFGRAEEHDADRMTVDHEDGVCRGHHWMKKNVSFKTTKMTNNPKCQKNFVSSW